MGLNDIRVEEQDLSSDDLTLEARDGEALEILARGHQSGDNAMDLQETVRETTMTALPSDDGDDDLFPEQNLFNRGMDVLGLLREMGYDLPTVKVPEGDTYTLSDANSNATSSSVYYRELPASSVSETTPGAPGTMNRTFITMGLAEQDSVADSTTVQEAVDSSDNPLGLTDWPWEEDVPSGVEYDVVAMAAITDDNSGDSDALDNVRLTSGEVDFLARDSARVSEAHADFPSDDLTDRPFVFPEPPTFSPGDELDVEVEMTNNSGASANLDARVALVCHRRPVGAR